MSYHCEPAVLRCCCFLDEDAEDSCRWSSSSRCRAMTPLPLSCPARRVCDVGVVVTGVCDSFCFLFLSLLVPFPPASSSSSNRITSSSASKWRFFDLGFEEDAVRYPARDASKRASRSCCDVDAWIVVVADIVWKGKGTGEREAFGGLNLAARNFKNSRHLPLGASRAKGSWHYSHP